MVPELGHFTLIMALLLAATQAVLPLVGAARGNPAWMAVARPAALGQFTFVAITFGCLAYAFLTNDFSVENVAHNSFSQLPPVYRLTATWGSHEGSLLLWILFLSLWTVAVAIFSRHLPPDMLARVVGVMGLVSAGFLLFILTTSNPFRRLFPVPTDGADLNPLLQDPGMVVHPPMLYMGYVGFSVAFAFGIAALLAGRLDAAWARWSRPWTTAAWVCLTAGLTLGSGWAYYELGWGGWWFWDPTENAALMPWLSGTALIHSLAVTEKRGSFRAWTVLLAITTFALSLLGTFLVRSGVLSSVHAFAIDPARGLFILALLALVIGGSLVLFALRAARVGPGGSFELLSRESLLLVNNVLLLTAAGSVLLGTLYPLFLDALGFGKISVGPPYFNAVFVPLAVPVLFLMGVGPAARWKGDSVPGLARRLRWAAVVSLLATTVAAMRLDSWRPVAGLGLFLALWVAATTAAGVRERLSRLPGSLLTRLWAQPASFYGMSLAHLGVAAVVVGASLVSGFETERDVRMLPGDTVPIAGYALRFDGLSRVEGANYLAARGEFTVTRPDASSFGLRPEKRLYNASGMTMTEAAIDVGVTRDLYVSLGGPLGGGAWSVRVYYKPFVSWIWAGSLLAVAGGLLALGDRRYRLQRRRVGERPAPWADRETASPAGLA